MSADDINSTESDRLAGHRHPRETSELAGHAAAEADLLEAFRANRLPHAWLIGGPHGIGKATLAWRFARFVLANPDPAGAAVRDARDLAVPDDHPAALKVRAGGHGDVVVLRREWNEKSSRFFSEIRIDEVRRASSMFQRSSRAGGYRICIIDSAEDLNRASANALLKLIEEPPPLSLFLVVSHRPAQILPTLRSRCRMLMLQEPGTTEIVAALRSLGPPWSDMPADRLAEAGRRSRHSVRGALHWLDGDRLSHDRDLISLLDALPALDWRGLHRLADGLGSEPEDFDDLVTGVLDWLHARLEPVSGETAGAKRRLAPLAEVWDKVRRSAREAEALNLDKRAVLLSIFADLAQATRML